MEGAKPQVRGTFLPTGSYQVLLVLIVEPGNKWNAEAPKSGVSGGMALLATLWLIAKRG